MLWPKKHSYEEFDNEKNSCGSKIPLPPTTFLMGKEFKIFGLTLIKERCICSSPECSVK